MTAGLSSVELGNESPLGSTIGTGGCFGWAGTAPCKSCFGLDASRASAAADGLVSLDVVTGGEICGVTGIAGVVPAAEYFSSL